MAGVAQLVERGIVIPVVAGSIPVARPTPLPVENQHIPTIAAPWLVLFDAKWRIQRLIRPCPSAIIRRRANARVAELVDALVLGTSVL